MILTRDGKEITAIYGQDGSEIEEVKDANGRIVYSASKEITGTLPLSFSGRGKPLTDYLISGNTIQDGTPTPQAPVDVVGCGARTENIYDKTNVITIAGMGTRYGVYVQHGVYSIYNNTANSVFYFINDGDGRYEACPPKSSTTITIRSSALSKKSGFFMPYNDGSLGDVSIVAGSTPPSYYIPYGYKLPLTANGTEYPIYLGQVPTTRKIKKLVLTGEENWRVNPTPPDSHNVMSTIVNDALRGISPICTHYIGSTAYQWTTVAEGHITTSIQSGNYIRLAINVGAQPLDDFVSFLAAQYAAGAPVTIWYTLAEPETGIVNKPLHKIGDYADTVSYAQAGVTISTVSGANILDMTSTVKPSEVYIKGRGIKPTGYGQLVDKNGVRILDKNNVRILVHGQ